VPNKKIQTDAKNCTWRIYGLPKNHMRLADNLFVDEHLKELR